MDIIKSEDSYIILLDIPGMTKEEITIYRRNVVTVVKGTRLKTFLSFDPEDSCFQKAERKFGEFTLSFKIPNEFERKWSTFEVEDGVLTLVYKKDKDDSEIDLDMSN